MADGEGVMTQQFDEIAEVFGAQNELAWRRHVEAYSFFHLLGEVRGKSVLDVACGEGLYTRMLKQRGAARVVGADISEGMIAVARQLEERTRLGVSYVVQDAGALALGEAFDVVTGIWLLHYAESREQLTRMGAAIRAHLVPGGRFLTIISNPDFRDDKPNLTKYGLTMRLASPRVEGRTTVVEVHTQPPFSVHFPYWPRGAYEEALGAVGFRDLQWHRMQLSPEGEAETGRAFWEEMLDNPPGLILSCVA
jgi:ubiquinone/menaquinone biosynthesis C-methylase UbiE